jgi:hypothetical protein
MVLTILSVLGGVGRAVGGVLDAIHGLGHGGSTAVAIDDSAVKKAKEDAEKALEDAKKNTDDAKKNADDAKKTVDDAKATKSNEDAKATKSNDDGKATKANDDAKATKANDDAKATKATSNDDAKATKATAADDSSASSDNAAKGSYADYKHKRDTIEKVVKNDPTVLDRKGMYSAYSDLSSCTYKGIADAETQVLGPRKRYDGEKKLLLDAVTERKVFERCKSTVDQLWRGLPHE